MDPRRFTTISEQKHKKWLGEVLDIPINDELGIDLLDETTGIELKGRYARWHQNYAVDNYQVVGFPERYPGIELYFAFLLYDLRIRPRRIRSNVEKNVVEREVRLLPWDWVTKFPVSYPRRSGPFIYVHGKDFPDGDYFEKFETKDAILWAPRNSSMAARLSLII
ncbi:MAG: hypothetical protein J4400_01205 [Candidatus Aenigmarchaeota archaeon]|nr:hypothetical protein [Candidatus Aenigmarchaeota archaeon]